MTDRELLELAAKAAGYEMELGAFGDFYKCYFTDPYNGLKQYALWDPLSDDGDALRLAVKLNIPVYPYDDETSTATIGVVAKNWGSKEANTRRAIVRVAAEIGRSM